MSDFMEMTEQALRLRKPKRVVDRKLLARVRKQACCVCGKEPPPSNDASHILTRGAGNPDIAVNVVSHCRGHHVEFGAVGPTKFFKRYPWFWTMLQQWGWTLENGKLRHPEITKGTP
jgi:hypothetical protein